MQEEAALINGSADQDEDQSMEEKLHGLSLNNNQVYWIKKHNEDVKKNREIFKTFIHVTSFECKQENVFKVYDGPDYEEKYSLDTRYLKFCFRKVEFVNPLLKEHWDNMWYFARVIENVELQNEVLKCLYDELWNFIETSIHEAPFIACIFDKAGFSSSAVTVRLVDSDGEVREYFLGFYEHNRMAYDICRVLDEAFEQFNIKNQLVAQSYDGHCLRTRELGNILTKTQEIAPQAMLTHNSTHHLYYVLNQSSSEIDWVDAFWFTIDALPVFFHDSNRKKVLEKVMGDVFPTSSEICEDSYSEIISVILTNRQKIIEVLQECARLEPSGLDGFASEAFCYLENVVNFIFVFLLYVFQDILDKTDTLLIPVQKMSNASVVDCIHDLKSLKNDEQFEQFMQLTETETNITRSSNYLLPWLQSNGTNPTEFLKKIYFDVLDDVTSQLEARFSRCEELSFLQLGDARKFSRYKKQFPTQALNSLMNSFGDRFDEERLKLELETIFSFYHTNRSKTARLSKMIKQMVNDGRKESLPEAFKLFTLIATIPASKVRSTSSTFSRIKSYHKHARGVTGKPTAFLALTAIEYDTLQKLVKESSDNLVQRLAKKNTSPVPLRYK